MKISHAIFHFELSPLKIIERKTEKKENQQQQKTMRMSNV